MRTEKIFLSVRIFFAKKNMLYVQLSKLLIIIYLCNKNTLSVNFFCAKYTLSVKFFCQKYTLSVKSFCPKCTLSVKFGLNEHKKILHAHICTRRIFILHNVDYDGSITPNADVLPSMPLRSRACRGGQTYFSCMPQRRAD